MKWANVLHANETSKGLPGRVFNHWPAGRMRQCPGQGPCTRGHSQDFEIWSVTISFLSHISLFWFCAALNALSLIFYRLHKIFTCPLQHWWSWLKYKGAGVSAKIEETRRGPVERNTLYTLPHIHYSKFWDCGTFLRYIRICQTIVLISHKLIIQLELN